MRHSKVQRSRKPIPHFKETLNHYQVPKPSLNSSINWTESSSISQESYDKKICSNKDLKESIKHHQTFNEDPQLNSLKESGSECMKNIAKERCYLFQSRQEKMMGRQEISQELKKIYKLKKNTKTKNDLCFRKIPQWIQKTDAQRSKLTFQEILTLDQVFMKYSRDQQINQQVSVIGYCLK